MCKPLRGVAIDDEREWNSIAIVSQTGTGSDQAKLASALPSHAEWGTRSAIRQVVAIGSQRRMVFEKWILTGPKFPARTATAWVDSPAV